MDEKNIVLILGILSSVFTFVTGVCFHNITSIIVSFSILGALFLFYAVIIFVLNSGSNSRDVIFSYAVSTACMAVALIFAISIMTDGITSPFCAYKFNTCTQYVFGSIFGFVSVIVYAVTSAIAFKLIHVW